MGICRRPSGRIQAKVFVIAIDGDMLFPPSDCEADQKLTPGSELKVIHSHAGHLGLFGLHPSYFEQIDKYFGELLAIPSYDKSASQAAFQSRVEESSMVST